MKPSNAIKSSKSLLGGGFKTVDIMPSSDSIEVIEEDLDLGMGCKCSSFSQVVKSKAVVILPDLDFFAVMVGVEGAVRVSYNYQFKLVN